MIVINCDHLQFSIEEVTYVQSQLSFLHAPHIIMKGGMRIKVSCDKNNVTKCAIALFFATNVLQNVIDHIRNVKWGSNDEKAY